MALSLTLQLDRISRSLAERAEEARIRRMAPRLRRLRLVERMDRLAIDGGGAVSPIGEEHGDAVPRSERA